jgi:H+/gluconate symporter-like permease
MKTPYIFRFVRPLLALVLMTIVAVIVFMLFTKEIPKENREMLINVINQLMIIAALLYGYYFGSNKDKSDQEQATREVDKVIASKSPTMENAVINADTATINTKE